jgi:hypothetical protein
MENSDRYYERSINISLKVFYAKRKVFIKGMEISELSNILNNLQALKLRGRFISRTIAILLLASTGCVI